MGGKSVTVEDISGNGSGAKTGEGDRGRAKGGGGCWAGRSEIFDATIRLWSDKKDE